MKRIVCRRMRKTMIALCLTVMFFVVVQTPTQVEASTSIFSEDFDDVVYLDANETTVTGWGSDEIRIPFKEATFENNCSTNVSSTAWIYDDYLYLCVIGIGVEIVNVTDSANPIYVSTIETSHPKHVAIKGNTAFVSDTSEGLLAVDITDINNPAEMNVYNPGSVQHFTIDGSYGYLATSSEGIHVLDISTPNAPYSVFNFTHVNATVYYQTHKVDDYLLALDYGIPNTDYALQIINATDPTNITSMSRFLVSTSGGQMHVSGDQVFVCGHSLNVISIANISDPELVADFPVDGWSLQSRTALSGDYIYGAAGDTIQMLDISNVAELRLDFLKILHPPGWIAMSSPYAFVSTTGGIAVYRLSDVLTAIAQSKPVHQITSGAMITQAMLEANDLVPSSTSVAYYLSADNGDTWEQVTPDVNHVFSTSGMDLLWRAILDTSIAATTPEIYSIDISMKIQLLPPDLPTITYPSGYNRPRFEWNNIPENTRIFLELDTTQTFDSPNMLSDNRTHFQPVISFTERLENGTWYYRFALIDADNDMGIFTDVYNLQIGTTSTVPPPLIDPLFLIVFVGVIGVVVVLVVGVRRMKRR